MSAPVAPASAQTTTIKVWLHDHPPRVAIDKAIAAEFEKANPDIKVQYDVIPVGEYGQKLLTAFAAGTGPDLFAKSILVTPVPEREHPRACRLRGDRLCQRDGAHAQYLTGFDGIRFGGRIYGVPTEVSNWVCYANNALWKEAGLDPGKDFPKTWEALPAVMEKLTQRDANGVPTRRGFDFLGPNRNSSGSPELACSISTARTWSTRRRPDGVRYAGGTARPAIPRRLREPPPAGRAAIH